MSQFKFSVGPWNVHPGADSYGPATRADIPAELDPANEIGFALAMVLKENGYGSHGEYVGLDVKAMRTTKGEDSYKHLENRDFEAHEMYVMNLLMGIE